jgi:hypothetical protein
MKPLRTMTFLLALAVVMAGCSNTNERGVIIDHGGWFDNLFGANTPATVPVVGTSPADGSGASAVSADSASAASANSAASPATSPVSSVTSVSAKS